MPKVSFPKRVTDARASIAHELIRIVRTQRIAIGPAIALLCLYTDPVWLQTIRDASLDGRSRPSKSSMLHWYYAFTDRPDLQRKVGLEIAARMDRNGMSLASAIRSVQGDRNWSEDLINAKKGCDGTLPSTVTLSNWYTEALLTPEAAQGLTVTPERYSALVSALPYLDEAPQSVQTGMQEIVEEARRLRVA